MIISGNLIGGEAFVFKLRPVNTTSNEDMLVQAHIDETKERRWRYEKHACGENPKVTIQLLVMRQNLSYLQITVWRSLYSDSMVDKGNFHPLVSIRRKKGTF